MAINYSKEKYICKFCKKENHLFFKEGSIETFFKCDCKEFMEHNNLKAK